MHRCTTSEMGSAARMSRVARGVVLVACHGVLVGCTSDAATTPSPESVGRALAPIIAGSPSTSDQDAVVLLATSVMGALETRCTGTLVAPNLVLTARHCVSDTDAGAVCTASGVPLALGAVRMDLDPASLFVFTGVDAARNLGTAALAAAHGKVLIHEQVTTLCDADLAFILLDRSVVGPVASLRLKVGARGGEKLTAVGYGLTEANGFPTTRLQRPGVPVTNVGPQVLDPQSGMGLGASEFVVGEAPCSGDSGGPLLSSKAAVVGVVSRGGGGGGANPSGASANCVGPDAVNLYTQLSAKGTFIAQAFAQAGAMPRTEGDPPGAAAGESCAVNLDCSSDACVNQRCALRCDDGTACVAPESCAAFGTAKVCMLVPAAAPAPAATASGPTSLSSPTTGVAKQGCAAAPARADGGSRLLGFALVLAAALLARASLRRSRTP